MHAKLKGVAGHLAAQPHRTVHGMDSKKGKRSSFLLDIRELRKTFDEVDTENKGYIDFDGLRLMINGILGMDASMAPELMESLDRDNDGKVTSECQQALRL